MSTGNITINLICEEHNRITIPTFYVDVEELAGYTGETELIVSDDGYQKQCRTAISSMAINTTVYPSAVKGTACYKKIEDSNDEYILAEFEHTYLVTNIKGDYDLYPISVIPKRSYEDFAGLAWVSIGDDVEDFDDEGEVAYSKDYHEFLFDEYLVKFKDEAYRIMIIILNHCTEHDSLLYKNCGKWAIESMKKDKLFNIYR